MDRINVVGTSCSGKTTLARALAERLAVPCIELDALFWGPGWQPVAADLFRRRVGDAVRGERWVLDGGYSVVRDLTWARADTIVWLDLPMPTVLARWVRRTATRIASGREFWPATGNRESIRHALGRESLLAWILTTHRRRRRTMLAQLVGRPDLHVVRLRSPAEAADFLARV